ncbi:MAG: hypothetical protein JSW27_01935 [Phycisphaerales bacterium]|nr:MAG: hypothetical protein JSW27_01935 [Phycisphaerales bacterium]
MKRLVVISLVALFATSAYADFVVYDTGGSQSRIQNAMTALGLSYVVRDKDNPVTAADLSTADALVVGWNYDKYSDADMAGLSASVLESSITGNILLTGHDADFHAGGGNAAQTFMSQAIDFSTAAGGTGLVAMSDYDTVAFDYLPASYGISATGGISLDTISAITAAGAASGVYDGLTTTALSNWGQSYHTMFNSWGSAFVSFELGGNREAVTIARVVPVPGAVLLGLLGLGAAGAKLRKRA